MPEGLAQRLVVIPAQYHPTSVYTGVQRLYDVMTYTVYYSPTLEGTSPPAIWVVNDAIVDGQRTIIAEVTDPSGVARVLVAYTDRQGKWWTEKLTPSVWNPDLWTGTVPASLSLDYFVQAVDSNGNVGSSVNKCRYFGSRVAQAATCTEVTSVTLDAAPGTLYMDGLVSFSTDIIPDTASTPYNYAIDYDDGTDPTTGTSSDDPLMFSHVFTATGDFDVTISVWNCEMTMEDAVSDTLQVNIVTADYRVYLPLVVKH
jgi:hypothetical protein